MEDPRSSLVKFRKKDGKLLQEALMWLTEFDEEKNSFHAVEYNSVWMKTLRRIKEIIKDPKKLILLYEWLLKDKTVNAEIREILLKNIKKEGYKQGLVMFISDNEIEKMLKTGNFNEQTRMD